jgi:hypothetical protein
MLDDSLYAAVTQERAMQAQWLDTHGWKFPPPSRRRIAMRKRLASLLVTLARQLDPPSAATARHDRRMLPFNNG